MLTCQTRPGPTPGDKGKGEGRASTSILIYICFQQSQVVVFSAWVDMLIHYYYAIYIGADGLSFYADDHWESKVRSGFITLCTLASSDVRHGHFSLTWRKDRPPWNETMRSHTYYHLLKRQCVFIVWKDDLFEDFLDNSGIHNNGGFCSDSAWQLPVGQVITSGLKTRNHILVFVCCFYHVLYWYYVIFICHHPQNVLEMIIMQML